MAVNNKGKIRKARSEKGAVAPIVVVLLVVLIGSGALVIDMGNLYRVRGELQNAADAAALAAASRLRGTNTVVSEVVEIAEDYANVNNANGYPITLGEEDVIFGNWNRDREPRFISHGSNPGDFTDVNAVMVRTQRSEDQNGPVNNMLAPIFGQMQTEVRAAAVAVGNGPFREICTFPLVIGECAFDETPDENGNCDYCVVFQDDGSDTGGWTTFGDNFGVPTLTNLIINHCYPSGADRQSYQNYEVLIDEETGECAGGCHESQVGEEIDVDNGNMMNTPSQNFCSVIQDVLRRGDPANPLEPFTVKVPVIGKNSDGDCDFKHGQDVVGYAAMQIWGAKCGNSDPGVLAEGAPGTCAIPPASDKYLVASLRCDMESTDIGGGGNFGLTALRMRLVN